MFAPWMETYLGKEQMEVLRALKRHFDPNNIMNPGRDLGTRLGRPPARSRESMVWLFRLQGILGNETRC